MILPVEGSVFAINMAWWLTLILDLAVKGALLVGLGWIVTRLMRGLPASIRSLVWTGVFFTALAVPLVLPVAKHLPLLSGETTLWVQLTQLQPSLSEGRLVPESVALTQENLVPHVEKARDSASAKAFTGNWPRIAVWVWLAGVAALSSRLLRRLVAGRQAVRHASPSTSTKLRRLIQETKQQLGIQIPVEVRISPTEPAPFVVGSLRPVLVLPRAVNLWRDRAIMAVLQHELAHVARHDYLKIVLVQLACVLHWFNPLMWRCARRARLDIEVACDDHVLASGTNPFDYAQQLLHLAARFKRSVPATATAVAMADIADLEERMTMILKKRTRQSTPKRKTIFAVSLLVSLLVLPVAATQLVGVVPALSETETYSDETPPTPPSQPRQADAAAPAPPAPPAQPEPRPNALPAPSVHPAPATAPAPASKPAPRAVVASPAPPAPPRQIDEFEKDTGRVILLEDEELEAMLTEFYAALKLSEHKNKRVMKADVRSDLLKKIGARVVKEIPEGVTGRMKLTTTTEDGTPLNVIIVKDSVDAGTVSRMALKISSDDGDKPGMTLLMMLNDNDEDLENK